MSTATAKRASENRREGMGPLPHKKGVAFRVWAPHARRVSIAGSFNDWSPNAAPLQEEDNGYWYGDVPGASVGDEYRYCLWLDDQLLWRIDPYARELTGMNGNAVVHNPHFDWTGDSFHTPPLNELVIYELHVGTFHRPDLSRPGTFRDVMNRLEHLQSLGVNAIELMPVHTFSGETSWGYHPAHLFAVERSYGGPRALKELVKQAHKAGLCVLLDIVCNHLGPQGVSLWRFDGWSENDGGGIYFYNDERAQTPWGNTRPDYGREEVRQYLHDNALLWIEEYHFDGLRIDGTSYVRSVNGQLTEESGLAEGWELLTWINDALQQDHPGGIRIAEDLNDDPWITKSTRQGGAGFSTQWDYGFLRVVRECVRAVEDEQRSVGNLCRILQKRYEADAFKRVIFTECHDKISQAMARVPTEIFPDDPESWWSRKRSTLAAAVAFTAPGVPMLFQGQEFLQSGWLRDTEPLQWERNERFAGIMRLYRDLIHLRLNRQRNTRGLCGQGLDCFHIDEEQKVLAFRRWDRGGFRDDVLVIANFSHHLHEDYEVALPAAGIWMLHFNSDAKAYCDDFFDVSSGDLHAEEDHQRVPVSIGPYSLQIYSLAKTPQPPGDGT